MNSSPTYSTKRQHLGCPALVTTSGSAPYYVTASPKQKKENNERTDQSSRKIKLSKEEIANLSDADFTTLVISMLTEMVEYGHKREEKVKAMQSE